MRFVRLAVAAAAGLAAMAALATPAYAATAQVFVVHGIPGQPVDVYVNGDKALSDFQPGKVAGPLKLEEGDYDIVLTKPGDPVTSPILEVDNAAVPGGANISLVAHLNADGDPALTPFANDVSKLDPGQTRLIVRHTAAAPAVDVRAGGEPVFEDLTNPKEANADLPAGSVTADVVLAGTGTVAIGPADLDLGEGVATIVYAIGSAEDKTLALVTQTIDGLHSAPGSVPSGTGGGTDQGPSAPWYAAGILGAFLVAFGIRRLAR